MNRKPNIAVFRQFPEPVLEQLRSLGTLLTPPEGVQDQASMAPDLLRGADAAFVVPVDRISQETLSSAPRLKFISSVGAGLDHVDLGACKSRGIKVMNTQDAPTEPTADLAFGLLLSAARRLPEADAFIRSGQWKNAGNSLWGLDVHHRQIGIVGMGRIGKAIARRALGFSMTITYHNRTELPPAEAATLKAAWQPLDELLATSDFVVLQAPLTDKTYHLIGERELRLMKKTAILVNSGRGGLVDEAALADALTDSTIAGAALDVFEAEPAVEPQLLKCPNLIMSPHIGTATQATRYEMVTDAIDNLRLMLACGSD